MISISSSELQRVCKIHTSEIKTVFETKIEVIKLCISNYGSSTSKTKTDFSDKLKKIVGDENIKVHSVNWFLKKSTKTTKTKKGVQRNISSINKPALFFKDENRLFPDKPEHINSLLQRLNYFTPSIIQLLLSAKPDVLIPESEKFKLFFPKVTKSVSKQVNRLILFLFDYSEFSKKDSVLYSKTWGAYKLTGELMVRTCLYCNRSYVITVTNCGKKIIRPELDHFFPKSEHPILALSFYNLIPSCHICNSNLKGKVSFKLDKYLHPYLTSFDKENVKFTYEPENSAAFFGDTRGLKVKLDTSKSSKLKTQIENNVKLFKLDEIYDNHQDVIDSLQQLQRKTNKKKISDIYKNILVDKMGKPVSMSEQEIYELAIRNLYNYEDFHKKPMAKFEKDIAQELKLIKK